MIEDELETENKDLQKKVNQLQNKNHSLTCKIESLESKMGQERKEKEKYETKVK